MSQLNQKGRMLNQKCLQAYGVGFDFLNRNDASGLINELLAL